MHSVRTGDLVAELPEGTVTFLFTDLAESTRLWEEFPGEMRAALARHDEILRDAIAHHHGHLVKMRGDGAHAAFDTADDAVAAAIAAQLALHREAWGVTGPLRVRMGLHTGTAELRGGDYFGTEVNRAARLMAIAHGGQVVCSRTTADLARGALAPDISLVDLHERQLRDLRTPEHVFQLTHPDLPVEFPDLRTLDAFPGNLPLQVSDFVGRDAELVEVAKLLGTSRVVTLTGSGGVGKTRLALQAAAAALPHHSDGAWFIDLASLDEGELVASEIVKTMGLPEFRRGSREEALVGVLARRDALLVLDNCEHLVESVARVADVVVRHCQTVTLLATSQEGLGVDGEVTMPVRPLREVDAERLFVERARAARHGFEVGDDNRAAVAELCRRLDGIPLAIELAAARVGSMSPGAILERIDERFRLLGQGRRTPRRRHQTLRAAVDWSYGLLSPEEQLVFERLSVFSGSFDLVAAQAVVADDVSIDALDVVDLVTGLVAKSIVQLDERSIGDRYRLLETMRDYGLERLAERREADAFTRRHALHYLAFAEDAGAALKGPDDGAWSQRITAELPNLRAALVHLRESGERQLFERVVIALAGFWWIAGAYREGLEWLTSPEFAEPVDPSRARAEALAIAANLAVILDRYEEVDALVEASLACSRTAGEQPAANAVHARALAAMVQNRPDDACRFSREAIDLARARDDPYDLAQSLSYSSTVIGLSADDPIAFQLADEAVHVARALGNSTALGMALDNAATIRCRTDPVAAIRLFDESTHTLGSQGRAPVAVSRTFKAVAHLMLGESPAAAAELTTAIPTLQEGGEPYQVSIALGVAAAVLSRADPDVAIQLLALVDQLRERGIFIGAAGDLDAQAHLRGSLEHRVDALRFAQAWSVGREMTLDDAVAVALDSLRAIAEST